MGDFFIWQGDKKGVQSEGMTGTELKQHIEDWMSKFQVTVRYDPSEAVKQLENLGLLVSKQKGTVSFK